MNRLKPAVVFEVKNKNAEVIEKSNYKVKMRKRKEKHSVEAKQLCVLIELLIMIASNYKKEDEEIKLLLNEFIPSLINLEESWNFLNK